MSDYSERLLEEFEDLTTKIEKLEAFILSPAFDDLPDEDKRDLREQNDHMLSYFGVLMRRVSRHCTGA